MKIHFVISKTMFTKHLFDSKTAIYCKQLKEMQNEKQPLPLEFIVYVVTT